MKSQCTVRGALLIETACMMGNYPVEDESSDDTQECERVVPMLESAEI
jgi:hypothetical protein